MADETQFKINGNFFIAKNITTNYEYFRTPLSGAKFTRTPDDKFVFFNNNDTTRNAYDDQKYNRLGIIDFQPDVSDIPEQRTSFDFADSLDSNGVPFASADAMDDWLSQNLGAGEVNVVITGFLTSVSTDATLTGDGTVDDPLSVVPIPAPSIGFYAQTVVSTTITNTTTESSIVGSGVGTLSVPADTFIVGDSFHAKIGGIISASNGDEITIRIKTGSIVLASTGLISLEAVTNLGWEIELDFTITKIGAIGEISTNGNFAYNRNTGSLEGFVFQDVQNIDTTIANNLDVTVEWNQAKTADQIYSSNFVLYKVY